MADEQWCSDPECNYNRRGIQHTCGQCSMLATVKCACWKQHLETKRYTAANVKAAVEADIDRLFAPWMVGRPDTYRPDPTTKALVALGYFLNEELVKLGANEADRKTQEWKYNRLSRTYDIWETAAECLNDVVDGTVEQNRKPHWRWG